MSMWRELQLAASTLVSTPPMRSHECERGTQECVRYIAIPVEKEAA
jgi:hypothetical protein